MPKKIRPSTQNREQSIAQLWKEQSYSEEYLLQEELRNIDEIEFYKKKKMPLGIVGIIGYLARHYLHLAALFAWKGDLRSAQYMQLSFTYMESAVRYQVCSSIGAKEIGRSYPIWDLDFLQVWQGLAVRFGRQDFVEWVTPWLQDLYATGNVVDRELTHSLDLQGHSFYKALQKAAHLGQWPCSLDTSTPKSPDIFAPLFDAAELGGDEWEASLLHYLDNRTAQFLKYQTINSDKRINGEGVLGPLWPLGGVLPTEIFTFQYAFKKCFGKNLPLPLVHPILTTPLMANLNFALKPNAGPDETLLRCHTFLGQILDIDLSRYEPLPKIANWK